MRIELRKLSDERHELAIVRGDGRRESVACETRSYLDHDLLHYAVESEARLDNGFWGHLAAGRTLAEMNDRSGGAMAAAPEMMTIEQIVGALSGVRKGRDPNAIVETVRAYQASIGVTSPAWLTEATVIGVQEKMRQLVGKWRATAYGAVLELPWP